MVQDIFIIYLTHLPVENPALHLGAHRTIWRGQLQHLPGGETVEIRTIDELLPAIRRYSELRRIPVQEKPENKGIK